MNCECTTCHSNLRPLDITLRPFARDERLDFVEHVLDVLNMDRFGRPRSHRLAADLDDLPEWLLQTGDDKPEHFYDLTERLRVQAYQMFPYHPLGVTRCETIAAPLRSGSASGARFGSGHLSHLTSNLSMPLARGSP